MRLCASQPLAVFLGKFILAVEEIIQSFDEPDQRWDEGPEKYQIQKSYAAFPKV
jgi:hypothetical protein